MIHMGAPTQLLPRKRAVRREGKIPIRNVREISRFPYFPLTFAASRANRPGTHLPEDPYCAGPVSKRLSMSIALPNFSQSPCSIAFWASSNCALACPSSGCRLRACSGF